MLTAPDIGSGGSASLALKRDQQAYPLSSVNLLFYGVAMP
jgi:hypothetical protein